MRWPFGPPHLTLVARAIRNAIPANRFARIIRNWNPYFYSAWRRFAGITRISDSRESPDSRESCESIRANHATKHLTLKPSNTKKTQNTKKTRTNKEGLGPSEVARPSKKHKKQKIKRKKGKKRKLSKKTQTKIQSFFLFWVGVQNFPFLTTWPKKRAP